MLGFLGLAAILPSIGSAPAALEAPPSQVTTHASDRHTDDPHVQMDGFEVTFTRSVSGDDRADEPTQVFSERDRTIHMAFHNDGLRWVRADVTVYTIDVEGFEANTPYWTGAWVELPPGARYSLSLDGPKDGLIPGTYRVEIARRTGLPRLLTSLLMPGVAFVTQWRYALDFDTIAPERMVSNIAPRPVLFIHGSADAIIPVEHAYKLQAAAQNAAAELWVLLGLGDTKGVWKMREAFLKRVVAFFARARSWERQYGIEPLRHPLTKRESLIPKR